MASEKALSIPQKPYETNEDTITVKWRLLDSCLFTSQQI